MRQRKVKNESERLELYNGILVLEGQKCKGKWDEVFGNNNPIFLELGCGKGQFVAKMAMENPDRNFIGIEGQKSVMVHALEKLERKTLENNTKLNNIKFVQDKIKTVTDYFEDDELSGIYLNFSDPWPKVRHAKRRLTYSGFLEDYKKVMKKNTFIEFKSDNDKLFDFTVKQFKECGLEITELTENLHSTEIKAKMITTEYEEKFKLKGKNINFVRGILKNK